MSIEGVVPWISEGTSVLILFGSMLVSASFLTMEPKPVGRMVVFEDYLSFGHFTTGASFDFMELHLHHLCHRFATS